jgi:hypothetical protein
MHDIPAFRESITQRTKNSNKYHQMRKVEFELKYIQNKKSVQMEQIRM